MAQALLRAALTAGLIAWTTVMAAAQPAAEGNLFTVTDVKVDIRAATASVARQRALEQAQTRATEIMLKRLTLSRDWPALPPVDAALVDSLVSGIEIRDEKIAATRYRASLTVAFDRTAVRGVLRRDGIPFSEALRKPMLVLPAYEAGGLVVLGAGQNPWRDAWQEVTARTGLMPFIVPGSALAHVAPDRVLALDPHTVDELRARYGAADILAAKARLAGTPEDDRRVLHVILHEYGPGGGARKEAVFEAEAGESHADLLARVAKAIETERTNEWKSQTIVHFDRPGRLVATVPISSLKEWEALTRRLNDNLLVQKFDILTLASNRARIALRFLGDIDRLRVSLAQVDIALQPAPEGDDEWRLLPRRANDE